MKLVIESHIQPETKGLINVFQSCICNRVAFYKETLRAFSTQDLDCR